MNLKEAFRYQNFLEETFDRVMSYLSMQSNILSTTHEHMRKKANPEAEDEKQIMTIRPYDVDNQTMVLLSLDLIDERAALTKAIAKAKAEAAMNMDAEILINKMRQKAATCFSRMAAQKASESVLKGTGYKFNAEGNQVAYTYDVKVVQTIDFNRNMVKGLARKLSDDSDAISSAIDEQIVSTKFNFTPKYFVSGSFEDTIETFKSWHETNQKSV